MVRRLLDQGRRFFTSPQDSVLSAATLIMFMIVASRILGLVRQRVLAHFFVPSELSLFFAAFRLPDLIFEVLVFGTFSSAFIPVFTSTLKKGERVAWEVAGRVVNIGLVIFAVFAFIFGIFAEPIYSLMAPGYGAEETKEIANLARILFAAQGFFVVSYVLTGVLESLKRFLIPALAPIFYNLGIIIGTLLLSNDLGLTAPAVGVVLGAGSHFLIQLPLARKLGFRFTKEITPNAGVRKIGKLAAPRVVDLSFQQIAKTVELYLASLISTASYTYFTFANTLQLLPVGLFGTSLAKAALPTLARQDENLSEFKKTLNTTFYEIIFLSAPMATALIVLRIPLVRLVFGTDIFDWEATVQTGMVLSAFALGVVFQSAVAILSRGFYALHDTKTPLLVSIVGVSMTVVGDILLVNVLKMPVWALALSFSVGSGLQSFLLLSLMEKKLNGGIASFAFVKPILKTFSASVIAGLVMYFLLKFFDRSVWVKRLSFLSTFDATTIPFERFVLDTRYTVNLFILTVLVAAVGMAVYIGISFLLRSEELTLLFGLIKRIFVRVKIAPPEKETELLTPPTDNITP